MTLPVQRLVPLALVMAIVSGPGTGGAGEQSKPVLKTESFDKDPGWEGHNNRIVPQRVPTVTQDFGYSKTNFAGQGAGELGGHVTRAWGPHEGWGPAPGPPAPGRGAAEPCPGAPLSDQHEKLEPDIFAT